MSPFLLLTDMTEKCRLSGICHSCTMTCHRSCHRQTWQRSVDWVASVTVVPWHVTVLVIDIHDREVSTEWNLSQLYNGMSPFLSLTDMLEKCRLSGVCHRCTMSSFLLLTDMTEMCRLSGICHSCTMPCHRSCCWQTSQRSVICHSYTMTCHHSCCWQTWQRRVDWVASVTVVPWHVTILFVDRHDREVSTEWHLSQLYHAMSPFLLLTDMTEKCRLSGICHSCMKKLSLHSTAQRMLLRFLLEGALSPVRTLLNLLTILVLGPGLPGEHLRCLNSTVQFLGLCDATA